MAVTLHQDVFGQKAGTEYSGDYEAWLVAEGYASDGKATDKSHVTSALVSEDPRVAANPRLELKAKDSQLEPTTPPVNRQRRLGAEEDKATAEATAELDGSVDPEKVKGVAPVEKATVKAAEQAAGTGSHELQPR